MTENIINISSHEAFCEAGAGDVLKIRRKQMMQTTAVDAPTFAQTTRLSGGSYLKPTKLWVFIMYTMQPNEQSLIKV